MVISRGGLGAAVQDDDHRRTRREGGRDVGTRHERARIGSERGKLMRRSGPAGWWVRMALRAAARREIVSEMERMGDSGHGGSPDLSSTNDNAFCCTAASAAARTPRSASPVVRPGSRLFVRAEPRPECMQGMDLQSGGQLRNLILNARHLEYGTDGFVLVMLTILDATHARLSQRLKDGLIREKAVLLQELHHRVATAFRTSPAC